MQFWYTPKAVTSRLVSSTWSSWLLWSRRCEIPKEWMSPLRNVFKTHWFYQQKKHGEDLAELKLRFLVIQAAGFFIGAQLQTPELRSVEQLGKMRRLLAPFRQYANIPGRVNYFWQYSPVNLQHAWERFQKAVAEAWKLGGRDSSGVFADDACSSPG